MHLLPSWRSFARYSVSSSPIHFLLLSSTSVGGDQWTEKAWSTLDWILEAFEIFKYFCANVASLLRLCISWNQGYSQYKNDLFSLWVVCWISWFCFSKRTPSWSGTRRRGRVWLELLETWLASIIRYGTYLPYTCILAIRTTFFVRVYVAYFTVLSFPQIFL